MDSFVNLRDFEKYALKILPKAASDFYSSGANDELTLKDNLVAFKRYVTTNQILFIPLWAVSL